MEMKQVTAMLLVCGLCLSLISCGKLVDQTGQESSDAATESDAAVVPEAEDADYVYDYQVSMDPIPKEIADLGGPCQGTIHAFPSKIRMGLTQKRMEEDPELKAEVEKRIPEIEEYLAENIGGEFQVEGVVVRDDLDWRFFCKETLSDYRFCLRYDNTQYFHRDNPDMAAYRAVIGNRVYIDSYSEPQRTENQKSQFNQMISEAFGECYNIAWVSGISEIELVTIHIVQFTDDKIDKSEEQVKVVNLWDNLKIYNDEAWYIICVSYYPTVYQNIMEKKFVAGYLGVGGDISKSKECSENLLKRGELIDEFLYDDMEDGKGDMGLDMILKKYQQGKYKKNKIWPYWLSE